ncbi:MAG TPA: DUF1629 domain-containing protein [Fimbriimonadaceae bacterium]|nr:DUF1629 domain-containing protein [Fimbriimonadaceae bacterium]
MPFIIKADVENFDDLLITAESEKLLLLDGSPRSESWQPLPAKIDPCENPAQRGKPVDFPAVAGGMAFSARALEALYPLIGDKIEALPLDCRDGRYYLINVLNKVELDEPRSEFRRVPSGRISTISKYAFPRGSTDGQHIFKLKQKPLGETFVSPEFKQAVEAHNLVGLVFHEMNL